MKNSNAKSVSMDVEQIVNDVMNRSEHVNPRRNKLFRDAFTAMEAQQPGQELTDAQKTAIREAVDQRLASLAKQQTSEVVVSVRNMRRLTASLEIERGRSVGYKDTRPLSEKEQLDDLYQLWTETRSKLLKATSDSAREKLWEKLRKLNRAIGAALFNVTTDDGKNHAAQIQKSVGKLRENLRQQMTDNGIEVPYWFTPVEETKASQPEPEPKKE